MQEIQHNFNQLYQGEQSKTFDEVDYLLDVTKLRADILELAKKCNLLEKNSEVKDKNLLKEEDCFPTGNERIARNGGIALGEFDSFTGVPKAIITPYGKISILNNDFYSALRIKSPSKVNGFFQKIKFRSNVKKFKQMLGKEYGLTEMQYDATKYEGKENPNQYKKAISKLPWKAVDLPSEIYRVAQNETTQSLQRDEKIYLNKVFDVVNTSLVMTGHTERIMPGTDNEYSVNGQMRKMSEIAANNTKDKFTKAMDQLREIRNPLNAKLYGMSPAQMVSQNEAEREFEQHEISQTANVDLDREM